MVKTMVFVIATFLLLGTQVSAQCSYGMVKAPTVLSPTQTVDQFVQRFNSGDMEGLQDMLGEGAWYAYGDSAPVSGEAMLAWLESEMLGGTLQVSSAEMDGDNVILAGMNTLNGTATEFTYVFNVKAGVIESWQIL
jgi:hypothetical protein